LMHPQGAGPSPKKRQGAVSSITDDEIREKYLERAIRELTDLGRDLSACQDCPRGNVMPVQGSGHPQADIFMLKHAATPSEIEEGVAFYGRAGNALMKSFKRLSIDPIVVFGTLCVKCPLTDAAHASEGCIARVAEEIAIVQPRIVVIMGDQALDVLNDLELPLAERIEPRAGEIQRLTPTIDALYVPDIDDSLDTEDAKQEFWTSFRALGEWYDRLPPY
jgi:uracil-DNA glycosylase family 4